MLHVWSTSNVWFELNVNYNRTHSSSVFLSHLSWTVHPLLTAVCWIQTCQHTHTHTHTPRVSLWSIPQDSILSSAREQSAQMEGWMRDLPPAGFQINKPKGGREYETAGAEMKRSASESSSRQTWRNPRTPTATCARWLHTAGLFICVQCTRPAFEDHCSRAQQHAVSDQSVWQEVVLQPHL